MAAGDRTRYYWDRKLECLVEIRSGMNSEGPQRLQTPTGVISDLPEFIAPGIGSKDHPNQPMVISGGRRQYRDELRTRGLIEVGNETSGWSEKRESPPAAPVVRHALEQAGFYSGARSIRDLKRQGRR